jgi:hypothetical protein
MSVTAALPNMPPGSGRVPAFSKTHQPAPSRSTEKSAIQILSSGVYPLALRSGGGQARHTSCESYGRANSELPSYPQIGYFDCGAEPGGHPSHLMTTAEVLLRADNLYRRRRWWSVPYTRPWKLFAKALARILATHLRALPVRSFAVRARDG